MGEKMILSADEWANLIGDKVIYEPDDLTVAIYFAQKDLELQKEETEYEYQESH